MTATDEVSLVTLTDGTVSLPLTISSAMLDGLSADEVTELRRDVMAEAWQRIMGRDSGWRP